MNKAERMFRRLLFDLVGPSRAIETALEEFSVHAE